MPISCITIKRYIMTCVEVTWPRKRMNESIFDENTAFFVRIELQTMLRFVVMLIFCSCNNHADNIMDYVSNHESEWVIKIRNFQHTLNRM